MATVWWQCLSLPKKNNKFFFTSHLQNPFLIWIRLSGIYPNANRVCEGDQVYYGSKVSEVQSSHYLGDRPLGGQIDCNHACIHQWDMPGPDCYIVQKLPDNGHSPALAIRLTIHTDEASQGRSETYECGDTKVLDVTTSYLTSSGNHPNAYPPG